ncbi:MAG: rhodanese-like domain-containing protein [Cyanobacteria bacterium P01_D01_bin.105]
MFIPVKTADGSSTFYSESFGEWFHSREGACREAQETYIKAVQLAQRAQALPAGQSLKILDVCYGLGYNTGAAIEAIWAVNPDCLIEVKALEIDIEVAKSAIAHNLIQPYSSPVQDVLKTISSHLTVKSNNLSVQLLLGDARQQIQPLVAEQWQADVIFLDPFSPPHCPQLWTAEFLSLVAKCLSPAGGELVTYSCAAAVRSALMQSGLSVGSLRTAARKWPGTIARWSSHQQKRPLLSQQKLSQQKLSQQELSQQEKEHLQTRAAVPYRDPSLCSTAKEILARRAKEQQTSDLLPTGPWRSRWKQQALGVIESSKENSMSASSYLISVQDLIQQLERPDLVIIDTRFSLPEPHLGRSQYQAGHIPGAHYLDLNQDLSSAVQAHGGRHPLPDWPSLVQKLSALGISSELPTQVVIYDDSRFAFAARLWWMLRYLGHERVAILDGGIGAWRRANLPMSKAVPTARVSEFVPRVQSNWTVDIEQVRQRGAGTVLVDSRSPERWRGEVEPIDPIAGSVPGSANAFWKEITTEAGFLKDADALSEHWASVGVSPTDEVMVYCGSGVTACVNLFSLVAAGHPMHKLYPGGWSDWCTYLLSDT